jgi:predicted esterase
MIVARTQHIEAKQGAVIMLHGWAQNGRVMQCKTFRLTKVGTNHQVRLGYNVCTYLHHACVYPASRVLYRMLETADNLSPHQSNSFRRPPLILVSLHYYIVQALNNAGFDCIFPNAPHKLPPLSTPTGATPRLTSTATINNNGGTETKIQREPITAEANTSKASATNNGRGGRDNARAWFFYDADNPSDNSAMHLLEHEKANMYTGLEESMDMIGELIEEEYNTPKHVGYPASFTIGLLGFSQGAVLIHSMLQFRQWHHSKLKTGALFRRDLLDHVSVIILCSGFPSQHTFVDEQHGNAGVITGPEMTRSSNNKLSSLPQIPLLHIIGRLDTTIPPHRSLALAHDHACFHPDQTKIHYHDKGHLIPQQSVSKQVVLEFIVKRSCTGEGKVESNASS